MSNDYFTSFVHVRRFCKIFAQPSAFPVKRSEGPKKAEPTMQRASAVGSNPRRVTSPLGRAVDGRCHIFLTFSLDRSFKSSRNMTHGRLWDWLSNVANEGRYGVTWIDSERSVILIPWPRRLDSSGENVFTAYAKLSGGDTEPRQLLRCALDKMLGRRKDFEALLNAHVRCYQLNCNTTQTVGESDGMTVQYCGSETTFEEHQGENVLEEFSGMSISLIGTSSTDIQLPMPSAAELTTPLTNLEQSTCFSVARNCAPVVDFQPNNEIGIAKQSCSHMNTSMDTTPTPPIDAELVEVNVLYSGRAIFRPRKVQGTFLIHHGRVDSFELQKTIPQPNTLCTMVELPNVQVGSHQYEAIEGILKNTRQGLLLEVTAMGLYGTRLCQTRIFYMTHRGEKTNTLMKLERKERKLLLNLQDFNKGEPCSGPDDRGAVKEGRCNVT
uniref:IRF tryptophan pentad repeat domain-containing protein n=2 Tax=Eptatretus burgeri TaxID=7764 RepID=A0A8C4WVU9_EPTBU